MTHPPGTRVGPYEVTGLLGSGGMGAVYRAHDPRLDRQVALKFLHASGDRDTDRVRLLREARAASALSHPAICSIYDVGEVDGDAYIAMELVDGRPIDAGLPAGGLPIDTVVRLGIDVADGLAHAHQRGIVHRDLKSANILRTSDGRVKVLDFGLARRVSHGELEAATRSDNSLDAPGVLAGTLAWMSPEVLRGEPADERSDLWALGVLLHQLSSGALPFSGATSFDLTSRILTEDPAPLPDRVPPALRTIIARLLDKDPLARYGSAAEVRAALQVVRQHDTHRRETRSPVAGSRQPGRRRFVMAALLVIAAGGIGAWLYYGGADLRSLQGHTLVSNAPGAHSSPAVSPDGTRVAFAAPDAEGVSQIWIQALPQGQPVPVTQGGVPSSRPRWHPDGYLVFARQDEGIWTVPELGGAPRRILDRGINPNVSADGSLVVYEDDHRIWLARADGSNPRRLEHVPAKYYSIPATPALSPDGTQVVYFRPEAGPNGDFWIAGVDGNDPPRQLTDDMREGGWPQWTDDGWILFSSARGGSRTLWQVRADGGEPVALTSGSGEDDHPELSRDGRLLLYTNVRKTWSLKVAGEAPGSERELLARLTEILFPQFSPDGRSITFFGRSDRAVAIFTIGADGDDLRQLTGGTELNHMPRWSHDGEWVYFFQIRPERSLRRVPALGGPSEAVLPFAWETHNFPQFDPSGRLLSYLRRAPGEPPRALIRDVQTSTERTLPDPAIGSARWSRDGTELVGHRADWTIAICPADGSDCRPVVDGVLPMWSADGTEILYIPGPFIAQGPRELRAVGTDGSNQRLLRSIGPFGVIDTFFDVSVSGQITWADYFEGDREIWSAQVR